MKFRVLESYYISTILVIMLANQNLLPLPTGAIELLMIGHIVLSSYHDNWRITLRNTPVSYYVCVGWLLPSVIIWVYSICIQLWYKMSSDYLIHTTTYCIRSILYTLFAVSNVKVHKERTVDIFFYACVLSYIPAWVEFISAVGISGGLALLLSNNVFFDNIALEVHTLTYLFGFLFLYYFYQWWIIQRKMVRNKMLFSFFLTVAGMKRIVLLSLTVIILLIFLLSALEEKKRIRVSNILSVVMVFAVFGYIAIIKYGVLEAMLQALNVDDSFRFNFWNHFRDRYSLSPLFMGFGISYAHRILNHEWSQIQNLRIAANIHNDILGFYLGLGCVGFLSYWSLFFRYRYRMLKRSISESAAVFSTVISVYYVLIMMTSNEGMMEFPHSIYFLMIYMTALYGDKDKTNHLYMGGTQ